MLEGLTKQDIVIFNTIDKQIGLTLGGPKLYDLISGDELHDHISRILKYFGIPNKFNSASRKCYIVYFALTVLSQIRKKKISKLTIDDIINAEIYNIDADNEMTAQLIKFKIKFLSEKYKSNWVDEGNGYKYIIRDTDTNDIVYLYNGVKHYGYYGLVNTSIFIELKSLFIIPVSHSDMAAISKLPNLNYESILGLVKTKFIDCIKKFLYTELKNFEHYYFIDGETILLDLTLEKVRLKDLNITLHVSVDKNKVRREVNKNTVDLEDIFLKIKKDKNFENKITEYFLTQIKLNADCDSRLWSTYKFNFKTVIDV
jgi:hypothetical protein